MSSLRIILVAALLGQLSACAAQTGIEQALNLPFPERKDDIRSALLKADPTSALDVARDLKGEPIKNGRDLARKSFLIDVLLDCGEATATAAMDELLSREVSPIVVDLVLRRVAYRRDTRFLRQVIALLRDNRVGYTISSPSGDRPVSIGEKALETLEVVTGQTLGAEGDEPVTAWEQWWQDEGPP